MEFITPELKSCAAVYKITIDGKWFYIGSSINIKARIGRWTSCLRLGRHFKNKNIRLVLKKNSVIRFEIIEIVDEKSVLRDKETKHIRANQENNCLLNRCPDANSPKGIRPYFGYEPRIKITGPITQSKPIAQFDINGRLIAKFPSIRAACRALKMKDEVVRHQLAGKRGPYKKTVFKKISNDGNFIDPPKFVRKKPDKIKRGPRPDLRGAKNAKSKAVEMHSQDGAFIGRFESILEAQRKTGVLSQSIHKALAGKRRIASGYVWKYYTPSAL